MGFDNEAHYFFSTDLQSLEKNRIPKEGQRSPSGAKVGYFLKKNRILGDEYADQMFFMRKYRP